MAMSTDACFKRFYASSFLADFQLVICTDSAEQHHKSDAGLLGLRQTSQPLPNTDDVSRRLHDAASSLDGITRTPPEAAPSSSQEAAEALHAAGAVVVPVHGVVLAAASPYFETLLHDWKDGPDRTLHMAVGEEQVEAAKALLGLMYTGQLPQGLPQADLLQLLLLGDRFDVRRAVVAAARALGAVSASGLEWGSLLGAYALPDHLWEGGELAPLQAVAWERLMQLFGDLEAAWASADGRARWRQLPLRAVRALAAADGLSLSSENTLLAALSCWVAAAQARSGVAEPELRALAACVRLPFLSPCYLGFVAMQHAWFRAAVDPLALARAAAYSAASPAVRGDLAGHAAAAAAAAAGAASSAAALRARSGGASAPGRSCVFGWSVDLAAVRSLYDEVCAAGSRDSRILRSPPHSHAGYEWSLQCEITQTRGATGFDVTKPWALGVFLTCQVRTEVASAATATATSSGSPCCPAGALAAAAAPLRDGGGGGGGGAAPLPASMPPSGASSPPPVSGGSGGACGGADGGGPSLSSSSGSGSGSAASLLQQLVVAPPPLQQTQLDFGFVPTAATISAREAGGGKDKRWDKSWEHAVVRFRASWGWPNFFDQLCSGWSDAQLERWTVDGQLQLQCSVRLLG